MSLKFRFILLSFFLMMSLFLSNRMSLKKIKESTEKKNSLPKVEVIEQMSSSLNFSFYISLFSILLLTVFSLYSLIFPLKRLRKKMLDFLNQRYAYQFTSPAHHEIGHLESAFHALAQKMILNMEELSMINQSKSEFLDIASHELRTPLTSIKGSLTLLAQETFDPIPPSFMKLIKVAEEESNRLICLVNDILDLSKIEAGHFPMKKSWFLLNELFEKAFRNFETLAKVEKVHLQKGEHPRPIWIYMDFDRIYQVLSNLISNAIKHSPLEGIVSLRTSIKSDQRLVVEVRDQGVGLSASDQKRIFEKFKQIQETQDMNVKKKSSFVKGTGLGLAISKALIKQHGGKIGVRSIPHQGSTFYFTLYDWKYGEQETRPKREKKEDRTTREHRERIPSAHAL